MKDFLSWLVGYDFLEKAYKFLGWPGVFIMLSAEVGLVISLFLLALAITGVIP